MHDPTAKRAAVFTFNSLDSDTLLARAQAKLGHGTGVTVMPNNEVLFVDYSDGSDSELGGKMAALRKQRGDNVNDLHYTALRATMATKSTGRLTPREEAQKYGFKELPSEHPLFKRGYVIGVRRLKDFSKKSEKPSAA